VTIGYTGAGKRPTIGNGVAIYAGAKVLGDITVGDGAKVGANAVVLQDVPPYYTAVGVPARLLPPKPERAVTHSERESAAPDATPVPRDVSRQRT
jgi:serine O-acetyltransferase